MRCLASGFTAATVTALALVLPAPAALAAGSTIETAAGTGVAGYAGDGGQAVDAQLISPAGVAVDGFGNVYLADDGANVVRRISPTGVISTVAGNGTAGYSGDNGLPTAAKLNGPTDVVLDAADNLYIADFGNHVVREVVAATGKIRTVAGNGTAGYGGDGGAGNKAKLTSPAGLDVDTAGNGYIADYGNGTVRKLSAAGTISTLAGTGVPGFSGDGGPASAAQLDHPGDVAVVGSMVYVADAMNARVRLVDGAGTISTVAGDGTAAYAGDGGPATSASLVYPTGLATDSAGDLFVADMYGHTIREVAAGTITTVAGTGVAGYSGDAGDALSAQLNHPARVNLDPAGNLYVSDWSNHVLRRVDALGSAANSPGSPSGVSAVAGDASADVSWTEPVNDGGAAITGYTVTPNDGTADLTPTPVIAGQTTTTVTGLTNGTAYTFTVTATNTAGTSTPSAASAPATPTAPPPPPPVITAPDAPTAVTATPGDTTADLSWTAPTNDGGSPITGYTVTPNDGTADLTPTPVVAGQTTTTVTGLTNGTAYTFTVTATNTAGTSSPSTPSSPVTPSAPAVGGGVPAAPVPPADPPAPSDPSTGTDTPAPSPSQPPAPQDPPASTPPGPPAPQHQTSDSTPVAPTAPQLPAQTPSTTPVSAQPPTETTGAASFPVATPTVRVPAHHRRHHAPLPPHLLPRDVGADAAVTAQLPPTATHLVRHTSGGPSINWQAVRAAVVSASKKTAVPAGLLLLIGLFLTIQNRLDRRDPKLALAPVYADPGVSFVPALS
jgi:hypothetical protein